MKHPRQGFAILAACCCTALLLCAASPLQASTIYVDKTGDTVEFTGITESSGVGDPTPLYGEPVVSGDSLNFTPSAQFSAVSLDGGPSDQTDGQISMMIKALPGNTINTIGISENGITLLNVPFEGDAVAQVSALGTLKVLEVNGAAVSMAAQNFSLLFTPQDTFQYSVDATPGDISYSQSWMGEIEFDAQYLPAGTTKVLLSMDNNVYAATQGNGSRAFIDKKYFGIDVDTEVPEPTSFTLMMLCGAGLGLSRARKSR